MSDYTAVHEVPEMVASVPALIRRQPRTGEVVVILLGVGSNGWRVNVTSAAPPELYEVDDIRSLMDRSGSTRILAVSYDLTDEAAEAAVDRLGELEPVLADWYSIHDGIIHSIRTGDTWPVKDWRDAQVSAMAAAKGIDLHATRDEVVAEVGPVEEPPTQDQADLIEALEDVAKRDAMVGRMARMDAEELECAVALVADAHRHFPTASTACVAAIGYALTGDMMRANIWTERSLSLDVGYTLAELTAAMLSLNPSPEDLRRTFSAV
jgi:hypothetical protein